MGFSHSLPNVLCCDNRSTIQIAHNDAFHKRTKHIKINCHFVHQHVTRSTVRFLPVSLEDQHADVFTKVHPHGQFHALISKLKIVSHLPP